MHLVYFAQVAKPISLARDPSREGRRPTTVRLAIGGPFSAGPIKIGFTGSIANRLRGISSVTGQAVALLGAMDGDKIAEQRVHAMFAHLRLGLRGPVGTEWFRPACELTNFIVSLPALDLDSPYGDWAGGEDAPTARVHWTWGPHQTRGAQLLTDAVETVGSWWPERLGRRADVGRALGSRFGRAVTASGVSGLMHGRIYPCDRMREAIESVLGVPAASWEAAPDSTVPHPSYSARIRRMNEPREKFGPTGTS